MTHLDDAAAMTLAKGGADDAARAHAARCPQCEGVVAAFRRLYDTVAEVAGSEAPPDRLLRWAKAYARTRVQPRRRWTLLGLLSGGTPLVPAVRGGGLTEIALLFGDDRHHLDLRVEPGHHGGARLHGHVVPLQGDLTGRWNVTVVVPDCETFRTDTDAAGEFWLQGISDWERASLVAAGSETVIVS